MVKEGGKIKGDGKKMYVVIEALPGLFLHVERDSISGDRDGRDRIILKGLERG